MVKVIILNPKREEFEVPKAKSVMELFEKLNLNLDGYIALINGKPVPEDESIDENCKVELLQVFSGG
ncbi:MAG: MoaD/ThiS family protein [Thermoplasmata archaeon]